MSSFADLNEKDKTVYKQLFKEYDRDRDGKLTKIETLNCLKRLGISVTKKKLDGIHPNENTDFDGLIRLSLALKPVEEPVNISTRMSRFTSNLLGKSRSHAFQGGSSYYGLKSEQTSNDIEKGENELSDSGSEFFMFDNDEDIVEDESQNDNSDTEAEASHSNSHEEMEHIPKRKPLAIVQSPSDLVVSPKSPTHQSPLSKPLRQRKPPNRKQKKALTDPKVREQLKKQTPRTPFFMVLMTLVLVSVLILELIVNEGIESMQLNPMAGPKNSVLVQMGGKFVPCMKRNETITDPECELGAVEQCEFYNNIQSICKMGGFATINSPGQWWRFITPIFLHVGIIHLLLNMIMLVRTGIALERLIGTPRMIVLYMLSGIGGNIFSALMATRNVSVGASSALFGFYGMLLVDLIQNWPLLATPKRDLFFLLLNLVLSLAVGVLPFVDNYAHIGGFVIGVFAGLIFMPKIYYSKRDRAGKILLIIISIPILLGLLFGGIFLFYFGGTPTDVCPWCVYLDCIPPDSQWCAAERP